MPISKIRNLGQFGIVADPKPFDLPPQAFSAGSNVRFYDGSVSRGPVFRKAGALAANDPRGVIASNISGATDFYISYRDGTVKQWSLSAETDVSITGYTPSVADSAVTNCILSGVLYQNRVDRVPWAYVPGAARFAALANWDATWRCQVLRAFNSSLIALNVTKGGTAYPNMVKTSDFALSGAVPTSWDATITNNNAYENVLAEMRGSIVDGLALGPGAFYIYSNTETWEMLITGDAQIYSIRRKFNDVGAINSNCVVEVDGKHYVFGANDLWVHDGTGKRSIADGRVRKFIFQSLLASKASQCFVVHNPYLKEVHFCFPSGDRLAAFTNSSDDGCNRSAVYNYSNDTWSFDDLPRAFAADLAPLSVNLTWTNVNATWDTIGGSWQSLEDGFTRGLFFVSGLATGLTPSLYVLDLYGERSLFNLPADPAASPPAYLERDGIDLDEVGADLTGYKTVRSIYPEGTLQPATDTLDFQFGAADNYNQSPVFGDWQSYDGDVNDKCDFMAAGRFLFMRMRYSDYKDFTLSGLDLDIVITGER